MESLKTFDGLTAGLGEIGRRQQPLRKRALSQSLRCRSCSRRSSSSSRARSNDFWQRVQQAWGVLFGSRQPGRRMKQRCSRLLVADRGFDADRLTQLYELTKSAMSQHVVFEEASDGESEGFARVERIGELQLQFNVRRIKSSAQEEPWAQPTLIEYEPDC